MRERYHQKQPINILCIGQIQSGKTYFLKEYTRDQSNQKLCGTYDIYAKKILNQITYFHELSQQEDLYLQKIYDGIVFFVDLVNTWKVTQKILRWMELQSKHSKQNIFKIPLLIVITKTKNHKNEEKWKTILQEELKTVVSSQQIVYFSNLKTVEDKLQLYLGEIINGKAQGIKPSNQNHIKLYGVRYVVKLFHINIKLTFFRFVQLYNTHVKHKFRWVMKLDKQKQN